MKVGFNDKKGKSRKQRTCAAIAEKLEIKAWKAWCKFKKTKKI